MGLSLKIKQTGSLFLVFPGPLFKLTDAYARPAYPVVTMIPLDCGVYRILTLCIPNPTNKLQVTSKYIFGNEKIVNFC